MPRLVHTDVSYFLPKNDHIFSHVSDVDPLLFKNLQNLGAGGNTYHFVSNAASRNLALSTALLTELRQVRRRG